MSLPDNFTKPKTRLRNIITGSAMVKCRVKPSSLTDYFYSTRVSLMLDNDVKKVKHI